MAELAPLILCMENVTGEEVALRIEPDDDFRTFLHKAKSLLGFDVDLNSITHNQPVSLNDNIYQFLLRVEHNQALELTKNYEEILDTNENNDDLVYILDDGTQIRASQIHFDNEDPPVDFTAEKVPFVKYTDDPDEQELDNNTEVEYKLYNIVESPVRQKDNSPGCSFVSSLPFKLVCNNTSGCESQYNKYLETSKTYATLNPVANRNKSPRSLIRENYKNYDNSFQRDDFSHYTREEILNMLKDSPVASLPYENQNFSEKRRHVRKTDPSRLVPKNITKPISYIDVDGVLIAESESQNCFVCEKFVDNNLDKLYLFDNEDQRLHRSSPQKKLSTQLKIICEQCLDENFKPCRMKSSNQSLNPDEYLVIRNNQQYIFQKINNLSFKAPHNQSKDLRIDSEYYKKEQKEFLEIELGSDGEIVTKLVTDVIVKDEAKESSSDVEIVENNEIYDTIIDNLDDADEDVIEFLGKYQCTDELKELKCRFCERIFAELSEVIEHGEEHKHVLDDGEVYPCPLCDYGYANYKWLKGHLKAAHEKTKPIKQEVNEEKQNGTKENGNKEGETKAEESSPIARRTRSSMKKPDGETSEKPDDGQAVVKCETEFIIETEVKQECIQSSDEEIWIVQAEDDNQINQQNLNILLNAKNGKEKYSNKPSNIGSPEILSTLKCRKRGRRPKTSKEEPGIRVPSQEDFIKRAQGRLRTFDDSGDSDTLLPRPRKRKNRVPTCNPQVVTCHNCNVSFTSKVRLKFHMQFHDATTMISPDGEYTCIECDNATFSTETELFDHIHFQHHKQKRWQCPVTGCGKTFYLRATLTKHSRTHTDTRRYVCGTCGKRFLDKQTLDEHGVTHLQIKPFQCHICLKQLTRRSRLRMHLRAHEEALRPRLVLVCAVCARAFRDPPHVQEHISRSPECIREFANELKEEEAVTVQLSPTSGLVRHTVQIIESPKLSKPIRRQVEGPQADSLLAQIPDEAKAIIRVVEIEKAFRCEYCEDVFYSEDGLNNHRVIHKDVKNPFICHICKVSFATYSRCTTHKTTHGFYKRPLADAKKEAKKSPSSKNEAGPSATGILGYGDFPVVKHFLCEDCGRSYLHWTYLQVHRRMKHATDNLIYKCNQCELSFPNRIPCRDCDEVLPNKTALYKHRKKEHSDISLRINNKPVWTTTSTPMTSQGARHAACAKCGHSFATAAALHIHMQQAHVLAPGPQGGVFSARGAPAAPARPHACAVCGHGFRTLSMLTEHARIHTGERPFPCDVCGLAFRRSTAMRNHRLIHTGVRAWACGRCPKRFRIRSDLRTHLRLKHPAHLAVLEVLGLNPTPEQVMQHLAANNISHDKVIEITKISFAKGTTSIIPNSSRALGLLANVPRTQVACGRAWPERPLSPLGAGGPARRGRGLARGRGARPPRKPALRPRAPPPAAAYIALAHQENPPDQQRLQNPNPYTTALNVSGEELSEVNVQLLMRDGVLANGNQMVQLQLDGSMMME